MLARERHPEVVGVRRGQGAILVMLFKGVEEENRTRRAGIHLPLVPVPAGAIQKNEDFQVGVVMRVRGHPALMRNMLNRRHIRLVM
ncbi:MAG: hypothetical protein BWY76_03014 [bacterium ADurb.Bin429]|nr:MAG: hypothetical protein BWY76_03014 [bacterium ADurb.Bin429]